MNKKSGVGDLRVTKILALWATLRSTSTAFETMMRERGDLLALHEPFSRYFYLSEERKSDRYVGSEINPD